MTEATRAAQAEAGGDDVKKRLMIVPNCHVTRLLSVPEGNGWRVAAVDTNLGTIGLPTQGKVIIALGTIESARLAMVSFANAPNASHGGRT